MKARMLGVSLLLMGGIVCLVISASTLLVKMMYRVYIQEELLAMDAAHQLDLAEIAGHIDIHGMGWLYLVTSAVIYGIGYTINNAKKPEEIRFVSFILVWILSSCLLYFDNLGVFYVPAGACIVGSTLAFITYFGKGNGQKSM